MNEQVRKILQAAILAPSGENSQPWKLEIDGVKIRLSNLIDKDQSLYNFEQRGSYVAHGALLENLSIAAKHLGYDSQIKMFPEEQDLNVVADIVLQSSTPKPQPLYDAIWRRVTNRKPYSTKLLENKDKVAIEEAALNDLNIDYRFIDNQESITELASKLTINERLLVENHVIHDMFFSSLNWTEAEEMERRQGFYINTLELPPPARTIFPIIRHWWIAKLLGIVGLSKKITADNQQLYQSCSGYGIILMSNVSSINYINAGRVMERIWLTATSRGLWLQPTAGPLYLNNLLDAGIVTTLSTSHRNEIRSLLKVVKKIFGFTDETVGMLFRIGRGVAPSAKSARRQLEDVVVREN